MLTQLTAQVTQHLKPTRLNFAGWCGWCEEFDCVKPRCIDMFNRSIWRICDDCQGHGFPTYDEYKPCSCTHGLVQIGSHPAASPSDAPAAIAPRLSTGGTTLYNLRDARSQTQKDVAAALVALAAGRGLSTGVDAIAVSRWERGVVRPSRFHVQLLAEHFGVTTAALGFTRPKLTAPWGVCGSATSGDDNGSVPMSPVSVPPMLLSVPLPRCVTCGVRTATPHPGCTIPRTLWHACQACAGLRVDADGFECQPCCGVGFTEPAADDTLAERAGDDMPPLN